MTARQYERLSAPFRTGRRPQLLSGVNKALTGSCYCVYPLLLLFLAVSRDGRFRRALLVPGISFVLLSLIRDRLNAKRPYEVLDIAPLIPKNTKGHSMPSRHVFCMFVIAMTFLWVLPWAGWLLLCFGVLLAAVRVIGGVHFPRDVAAGALAGIVSGAIGFWIIP